MNADPDDTSTTCELIASEIAANLRAAVRDKRQQQREHGAECKGHPVCMGHMLALRIADLLYPAVVDTVATLRAKVKPTGPWFDVPAGTPEADCARCDADFLFWIKTKRGKPMLVDCAVEGGRVPQPPGTDADGFEPVGRGVAHFATCPAAASFSTRGKR